MSLFLRSFLFNFLMVVSIVVYAPLVLAAMILPPKLRYRCVTLWAALQIWLLKVICGIRHQVEGREHLPDGPAIILSKHQSAWETIAYQLIFPPFTWVLKRELLWIPLFGWALAVARPIAIDRASGKRAIEQIIEQGRKRLESGLWVMVFPEGTRVAPGRRRRYGIGGAMLASNTGVPVVPVAHNAGSLWPRRGFMKYPGTIRVVIGPVIPTRGRSAEEITRAAEDWIEAAMSALEQPAHAGDSKSERPGKV